MGGKSRSRSRERIVTKLGKMEVELAKGQSVAWVCRKTGITEQTY